jgi:excisionase family DNA binding protein
MSERTELTIAVTDELLEEIALRAARRVADQIAEAERNAYEGYLTPIAAAHYLGVSRQRIYQLTSARILLPDGRDGRTPLFTRETLDRYVRESAAKVR